MYEKILVPLDGSVVSEAALPYAEELAGKLGSGITLASVCESGEEPHCHMAQAYLSKKAEAARTGAQKKLELVGREVRIEVAVLVGDPAEQIVDYADREDFGLIVMATHGRSGIRRWTLGSVADKVVRATRRPVILVRAGKATESKATGALDRILVCLDGSGEAEAILPQVEAIASRLKSQVVLIQVLPRVFHIYPVSVGIGQIPFTDEEMKPLLASTRQYLESLGEPLERVGVVVDYEVRVGDVAEEIIRYAEAAGARLVAMTTHGRSGVGRWVLGSVADKVLREGTVPLLLVRSPAAQG